MQLRLLSPTKLLLMLASVAPTVLLAQPLKALPSSQLHLVTDPAPQQFKPFIDAESRYDSIGKLKKNGGSIFQQDGGTGKEASDDKKKESKDGKEQCESGNCGGIMIPNGQERLNPPDMRLEIDGVRIRSALPNQLLSSQQPII
jgi:hypothetical protein